jgi:predicted nucleic acid-binding protein
MTATFGDTSYFVAAFNPRDQLYAIARDLYQSFAGRLVTTEFVLIEVANFYSRAGGRATFQKLLAALRADPGTEIVPATSGLFARGFDLFVARPDKDWSLTDCISFVAMEERKIIDALTADEHYAQAGYKPLLRAVAQP